MKLIEKLAQEHEESQWRSPIEKDHLIEAYEAGFRAARDLIVQLLEEVGPGAPDTMGVTDDFGEEEV